MGIKNVTITIFGSGGGVAKAFLSLLNHSMSDPLDPLHKLLSKSKLNLVDIKNNDTNYYKKICPNLIDKVSHFQLDLHNLEKVRKHLIKSKPALIVDLSWADTVEMLKICNELGISYVNSALENVDVDNDENLEGFTLIERFQRFTAARNNFTNMKGIICSGMNPGIVNWMAHSLIAEHPDEQPLACYIVEKDNTFYKDKSLIRKNTIYSSWSPECFLDEAILNYPMLVKDRMPLFLYNDVYEQEFKVTLGDIQFYGCLMPHEEVLSLASLYNMEAGFIYKVNDYTTRTIIDNLNHVDDLWDWKFKVFDPLEAELEGEDLVGVLLVYEDKERYMYNVMYNNYAFQKFKINATYLQVACGVYAATCTVLLETIPQGVYFVEELLKTMDGVAYGRYVSQHMTDFVKGENPHSDGLILNRMSKI